MSASATLATSRAPGWYECGSPPAGSRPKTSTLSPPTTRAQSATKLAVATTWIGGGAVVVVASATVGCGSSATSAWVSPSSPQAARKAAPSRTRPIVKARASRPKPNLRSSSVSIPYLPFQSLKGLTHTNENHSHYKSEIAFQAPRIRPTALPRPWLPPVYLRRSRNP